MAWTLVVNPGSSSKKYALYRDGVAHFSMKFERTALGVEQCTEQDGLRQKCEGVSADTFASALDHFITGAIATGVVDSVAAIERVAVRVVVPGSVFQKHTLINDFFIHALRDREGTAPLHIPHTLKEIVAVQSAVPHAQLIAVSDSAFHATIPDEVRGYSLPSAEVSALDLYRFGYHGLSAASIVRRHHAVMGSDPHTLVVCHIGSGVSVTAVRNGKSVFNTMGYAPGTGMIMASRAGDLDTGALLALMRTKNWRPLDAQTYLSTHGGLQGLAGTPDLRLVIEQAARGVSAARQAFDMFTLHLAQGVARAVTVLEGLQTLVFTATAGERSPVLRARVCERLRYLGVRVESEKNEVMTSKDGVISAPDSTVKVAVIRTDEMGEMFWAAKTAAAQIPQ